MRIGSDITAVWVASVPRTGSMWTFNIARELVRMDGTRALPEIVPQSDEEMEAIGKAGIESRDGVYVLKVHTPIAPDLARSFFIVTHRDLRDSLVSFMRFTHADFDAGMRFVVGAMRLEAHFADLPAERTLQIEYRDITDTPERVVRTIADALGIDTNDGEVAALVARYSKSRVRERIGEREQALRDKIGARQAIDRREFVPQGDRSLRAFDVETGFQSGHVSDYREGDWRRLLTVEQQAIVESVIAEGAARLNALGGRR